MTEDCSCIVDLDCEDGPEFASTAWRTARKPHICVECRGQIQPGERYERVSGKWDRDFLTLKTCEGCADIRGSLFCSGWTYGEMFSDLHDADVLTVDAAPSACVLRELSPAGAAKLKAKWAVLAGVAS